MNLHKICDFALIYLLLCPFFNCLERTLSLLQGAEIQINTTKHINNSFGVSTLDDIQDLFKKAENGDANAQYELAQIYAKGQLLLQDKKKAYHWLSKAAIQGNLEAQHNLALMYHNGIHVQQDYKMAIDWYQKAANHNLPEAQCNLGYMFEKGLGVKSNTGKAINWYLKAAKNDFSDAQLNLALLYEEQGSQDKSIKWYHNATKNGNSQAQFNLANKYEDGRGVKKDDLEAERLYLLAAEQGLAQAQNNLGIFYATNDQGKRDYEKALKWFEKAAAQRNISALRTLAMLYYHGEGVPVNYLESHKWALLAYMCGREDILPLLGKLQNNFSESEFKEADKLFQEYIDNRENEIEANNSISQLGIDYSKTQKGFELLKFNGIYMSKPEASSQKYLRLYDDGVIIKICSSGTTDKVIKQLTKENKVNKYYLIDDNRISFTSYSYAGAVEYRGEIQKDKLILKWHSQINGKTGEDIYKFLGDNR